jgi:hypothetical protein
MATDLRTRKPDVVLRDHERETWEKLLAAHQDEWRAGMFRALFEDVRPASKEYFAEHMEAASPAPVRAASAELLAGMYSALFDDVRSAW